MSLEAILTNLGLSVLFAVLGFILLVVCYRVFDALNPADLHARIFEDGNVAAAIVSAAFIIGLAIIIAAAIA